MTIDKFIDERRADWQKLEEIMTKIGSKSRNLSREDLDQLGSLYRRTTSDLAFARTHFKMHEITEYLNHLVARAYSQIYMSESFRLRDILRFYAEEFPRAFQRTFRFTLIAALVFILSAFAGYLITLFDRETASAIIPERIIERLENNGKVEGQEEAVPAFDDNIKPILSSFIMTNNIQVAFIAFSTGILLGLGTIWVLIQNGLLIGVLACLFQISGQALPFWALILPHGILELTAIFTSGGAGFVIGYALIDPGDLTRKDSLILQGREAIKLILGVIPILVIAGIIEGFVTPLPISPYAKLVFAALTAVVLFVYLFRPLSMHQSLCKK